MSYMIQFVVFKKDYMQIPLLCQADRSSVGGGSDDGLSSFDSDGFSIGDWNNINQSTINYVSLELENGDCV